LAQGEFDTFIKAPSRDRAELLERITGTQIYSEISRAVFSRAKQEREQVLNLKTQLDEHRPLSDADRAAAQQHVAEASVALGRIQSERAELDRAAQWYDTKARQDRRLVDAEMVLGDALRSDKAAESDRIRLVATKNAFSMRAELEAFATEGARLAIAEQALADALAAEQQALVAHDQIVGMSAIAKIDRDESRAAYDAIGPFLDRAQRLDALIDGTHAELDDRQSVLAQSVDQRDVVRSALVTGEGGLETASGLHEADNCWLAAHQDTEALVARIEDVSGDLAEHLQIGGDIASSSNRIKLLTDAAAATADERQNHDTLLATLQAEETDLVRRLAEVRAVAATIDRAAVEGRRETASTAQTVLAATQEAADTASKAVGLITSGNQDEARQVSIVETSQSLISRIASGLPADQARLDEARRNLYLSEAAGDEAAAHLRLLLEDGQPCPVCGATEHPITAVDRVLRARVSSDRQHVADLEKRIARSQADRAAAEARIIAATDALQGIGRRRSEAAEDLETARTRWRTATAIALDCCDALGLTAPAFATDGAEPNATEPISPLVTTIARVIEKVSQDLGRATTAEADATKLSELRENARTTLESLSTEVARLNNREQTDAAEVRTLGATRASLERSLSAVSSRLDAALIGLFPEWRDRVRGHGAAFAELCRELVREWNERQQRAEATEVEVVRLQAELEGKRAILESLEVLAKAAETRCSETQRHLDELTAERARVIGGRPVGEVRTEYHRRFEAAEQAWNDAEADRAKAAEALAVRSSQASISRIALEVARHSHTSADQALAERLRAGGLVREDAEAAIARGEAWVQAEQVRLDCLRDALTAARTTLSERRDAIDQHLAAGIPPYSPDELSAALSDVDARQTQVVTSHGEAIAVIAQDDYARARAAEIRTSLEGQLAKARVWERLDEIVGSADGAKFRRFAQSLTFGHVIHLANRHLADLHPRYELERATGGELVLQVIDRDMANEVRGVHNLSGGERFLVSLALALGLASMSSGRGTRVESLFIDEGFGSLDGESLAMAVSVLEQLRAVGRRVGVVSHVDEIKERVAARVEVTPVGGGRSTVNVVTS
ncbi:MAG: SbcC/MukB-like Walker B domain-containing protein, partial [bacterium]